MCCAVVGLRHRRHQIVLRPVILVARRVRQHLANRHLIGPRQFRQILPHRIVHRQLALLLQHQNRRRRELLRDGPDRIPHAAARPPHSDSGAPLHTPSCRRSSRPAQSPLTRSARPVVASACSATASTFCASIRRQRVHRQLRSGHRGRQRHAWQHPQPSRLHLRPPQKTVKISIAPRLQNGYAGRPGAFQPCRRTRRCLGSPLRPRPSPRGPRSAAPQMPASARRPGVIPTPAASAKPRFYYYKTPRSSLDTLVHDIPATDAARLQRCSRDALRQGQLHRPSASAPSSVRRSTETAQNLICTWPAVITRYLRGRRPLHSPRQRPIRSRRLVAAPPFCLPSASPSRIRTAHNNWIFLESAGNARRCRVPEISLPTSTKRTSAPSLLSKLSASIPPFVSSAPPTRRIPLRRRYHLQLELLASSPRLPTPALPPPQLIYPTAAGSPSTTPSLSATAKSPPSSSTPSRRTKRGLARLRKRCSLRHRRQRLLRQLPRDRRLSRRARLRRLHAQQGRQTLGRPSGLPPQPRQTCPTSTDRTDAPAPPAASL